MALVAWLAAGPASAGAGQVLQVTSARANPQTGDALNVVIRSQYRRLSFPQDIQRIAVGDTELLTAELITTREVLVLGRETGRTTLIIWFANGASSEYRFSVERDLSVLERALRSLHPSVTVESAPDRDALVLTGVVADLRTSQTAELMARNYLEAGNTTRGALQPLVEAPTPTTAGGAPAQAAPGAATTGAAGSNTQLRGGAVQASSGAVINLLRLETLPPLPEERIRDAVRTVGGEGVTVRRVLNGDLRDDARDTLVLEGRVPNQTALMRVLVLAAQTFAGRALNESDIRVIADEAGGLTEQTQGQQSQQTQLGGGATSSLFGGARGSRLTNQIRTNLGRATAIEVAGGRILSFIEVIDLPQVRVDIRLIEVNRTKLLALNPNAALVTSDFRQPSLNPAQSATTVQGEQAARVGSGRAAIQNVLSFLNGGFLNELQYAGAHAAIDSTLSLLEKEGIARSLSSPSLTVLSGELAQVQIGGEIPVPTAFAPAFGGGAGQGQGAAAATPGVFSSVEFVPYGVQLQIRPLVGDDDTITLDVQPLVVTPDAVLTDTIRQSTGTAVATTAFQTRALRTSSRLQDGQALLIGGLLSDSTSSNTSSTPGLQNMPLIGRLFRGFNRSDQTTELIVLVNPVILRSPVPDAAMWTFPTRAELLQSIVGGSAATR